MCAAPSGHHHATDRRTDRLYCYVSSGNQLQHHGLAGIALAIAEMTDAAIVMVENAHKHLARLDPHAPSTARRNAIIAACQEVGPALFFSLLIITVSFLPIFTLEAQEGRMFQPLAFTKRLRCRAQHCFPLRWCPC